ncbi:MAG: hypothetical protein FWH20_02560 [Oscillospiraceae bacterium]|nr:hypothetical protein [Oscillospiraceae bacterium]
MKKFTAIILAAAMAVSLVAMPAFAATTADALAILRHVAGGEQLSVAQKEALGLGADEAVTTAHALAILKNVASADSQTAQFPALEPLSAADDLLLRTLFVVHKKAHWEYTMPTLDEENLSEALLKIAQEQYAFWTTATADDVEILKYLGTYDGSDVLIIQEKGKEYAEAYTQIGEHVFPQAAWVHKDGRFYEIGVAYKAGYLTDDDIGHIAFYAA